jgi:hypothetical protein
VALFIHFLPSTQPKMRLRRGRESDDSGDLQSLQSNFLHACRIKMILCLVGESDYLGIRLALQTNLVRLPTENTICPRSRKRFFKETIDLEKTLLPSDKLKL